MLRAAPTPPDRRLNPVPPPSPIASVVRNSAANLGRVGTSWLVALLLPPLLVRVLDKPTYGTWMLILQIGAYVGFLDGGIQNAIARFVGRAAGMHDRQYMGRMLSSAALVLLLVAGLTLSVTLVLFWELDRWFPQIPAAIALPSRQALLFVGISLAATLPFSTFAGGFFGLQMNHVNAMVGTIGRAIGAAGAAWAAFRHDGLAAMALWIGAGNLLQASLFAAEWYRRPELRSIRVTDVHRDSVREFVHFCYAMFATQFGAYLITGLDMPVVAKFDFHATAYYAVAALAGNLIAVPMGAIVSTLIPIASGFSATSSPERLGAVVLKTTRLANCILCFMALAIAFGMHLFLHFWAGSDYAQHALLFALILLGAQFIRQTLTPYASIGFAAGQQHRMLAAPLVEGIVNLACSLVGTWIWGAIGVAIGTLIGAFGGIAIHFAISMPRTDALRFRRRQLAMRGILLPVACCMPAVTLLLIKRISSPTGEIGLIFLGELLTGIFFWFFVLTPGERREGAATLLGLLHRMRTRPATSHGS